MGKEATDGNTEKLTAFGILFIFYVDLHECFINVQRQLKGPQCKLINAVDKQYSTCALRVCCCDLEQCPPT